LAEFICLDRAGRGDRLQITGVDSLKERTVSQNRVLVGHMPRKIGNRVQQLKTLRLDSVTRRSFIEDLWWSIFHPIALVARMPMRVSCYALRLYDNCQ
jgi:hypothetical protein